MSATRSLHVRFSNIRYNRGARAILCGLSGTIRKRKIIGIIGANGSGKTTFLQLLANWRQPHGGHIEWFPDGPYAPILIPANATDLLLPWYTVRRNLAVFQELAHQRGCTGHKVTALEQSSLIERFQLTDHLDKRPYELSSGEQARVALTCGLLYCPSVLMLDEVFTHIDWRFQKEVAGVLQVVTSGDEPTSLVLVSHAPGPIFALAHEIWELEPGQPLRLRPPEKLRGSTSIELDEVIS